MQTLLADDLQFILFEEELFLSDRLGANCAGKAFRMQVGFRENFETFFQNP